MSIGEQKSEGQVRSVSSQDELCDPYSLWPVLKEQTLPFVLSAFLQEKKEQAGTDRINSV